MLEDYSDARTWEKRLGASLPKVRFIAELPLTHEDWARINDHVVSVLQSPSESSLDDAITSTPAVIACYLVLRGVYTYPEEPFWTYCNSQYQQKLGEFFLDFVKEHGLASISVPISHRYITAILFHGFIPRSMVPSLYSQVIHPLVKREFVDPTSEYELQHWIDTHRAQYVLLEELLKQYRVLHELEEEAAFWREEAKEFAIDVETAHPSPSIQGATEQLFQGLMQLRALNEKVERLQHQLKQKSADLDATRPSILESGSTTVSLADFRFALYRAILMHARDAANEVTITGVRKSHQVRKPTFAADGSIQIQLPSQFLRFLRDVVSTSYRSGPQR